MEDSEPFSVMKDAFHLTTLPSYWPFNRCNFITQNKNCPLWTASLDSIVIFS